MNSTEIPQLIEGNDKKLIDSVTNIYMKSYSFEEYYKQ